MTLEKSKAHQQWYKAMFFTAYYSQTKCVIFQTYFITTSIQIVYLLMFFLSCNKMCLKYYAYFYDHKFALFYSMQYYDHKSKRNISNIFLVVISIRS